MMKRNTGTRLVGWLLAVVMLFGAASIPVSVSAQGNVTVQERESGWAKALDIAKKVAGKIIEVSPEAVIASPIEWGIDWLLDKIFGLGEGGLSEEEREYFEKILSQLDQLEIQINDLQGTVNSQTLADLLNFFKDFTNSTPSYVYSALYRVELKEATEEERKKERLNILTEGLGVDQLNWGSVQNSFDIYTQKLANAMLTPYEVVLDNQPQSLMMLQVQYQYLRRKYHWENQALDEWMSFQSYAVNLLVEALTIEKYSLLARMELIKQWNTDHPDDKRSDETVKSMLIDPNTGIQALLNKTKEIYGDNTDWIATPHDPETYRYYWYINGSKERNMLFSAYVTNQELPHEDSWEYGTNDMDKLHGVEWADGLHWKLKPVWEFWRKHFRPDKQLINEEEAKLIYEDYKTINGGSKSFYDIFIGKDEGNFLGLDDPGYGNWRLTIDPNDHPIICDQKGRGVGVIHVWFLDAMHTGDFQEAQDVAIAFYSGGGNELFESQKNHIGINILSTNGELMAVNDTINLKVTHEGPDGWTEADGDLEISMDKAQGSPESVTVDGKTLNKKYFTTAKRSVTIKASYLSTLSKGVHTFVATAPKGTMTYVLRIGKQAMLKLPTALKKIAEKAFAGIDAVNVMIPDSCKEIGAGAFKGCANLRNVYLPDDVKIDKGAFSGCPHVTFICSDGSAAAKYADQNGIPHHN